jgi:small-conductance mechanosensitive channel
MFWTTLFEIGNWVEAEQSTGRVVTCPNSSVLTTPTFNYTKGFEFIWNEIPILITFESDFKKAEQIIQQIGEEMTSDIPSRVESSMEKMSHRYMIRTGHLTPIVYTTIKDSGVLLTLRYLTDVRQRRTTEMEISRKILDAFAQEDGIDFAYPTYRLYRMGESIED